MGMESKVDGIFYPIKLGVGSFFPKKTRSSPVENSRFLTLGIQSFP